MFDQERLRQEALSAYIPVMRPRTAALLAEEVEKRRPKRILEIGTCIGLGTYTVLSHCDGKVTTLEIDEDRYTEAKANLKAWGVADRAECILGDCKEILPLMKGNSYDFVVLDGPKSYYRDAYFLLTEMLTDRGVLFIDDILFHGMTEREKVERKHRTNVNALRDLLQAVAADDRVGYRRYDWEDGVLVVTKKEKS